MKKLVFASLIIASTCLIAFSCKNGGENNQSDNSEKAQPEEEAFVLPQVDDVCSQMDDPSFIALCKKNFDTNSDGKVSMEEASAVTELVFDSPYPSEESESRWEYDEPLKSLKGIEYFPNLEILVIEYHQVTSLDISHNPMLSTVLSLQYLTAPAWNWKKNDSVNPFQVRVLSIPPYHLGSLPLIQYLSARLGLYVM